MPASTFSPSVAPARLSRLREKLELLAEAFVGDALRAHLRCEHCPEDVQSQPKTAKVAMSDASVASAACVRIVPLRMRSCVR